MHVQLLSVKYTGGLSALYDHASEARSVLKKYDTMSITDAHKR